MCQQVGRCHRQLARREGRVAASGSFGCACGGCLGVISSGEPRRDEMRVEIFELDPEIGEGEACAARLSA